jgi:hypothetical protein
MAYNISRIRILSSAALGITDEALGALTRRLSEEQWVPETFRGRGDFASAFKHGLFPWSGECSGNGFELLRDVVLPAFDGSADLVVCWVGGESFTGLRLRDHRVTAHKVEMGLGEIVAE